MAQNKAEVPAGFPKRTMQFTREADITSTQDPTFTFTAQTGMTPLSLRFTATGVVDRTTADETYIISMEDDDTKISTDNAAALLINVTYEATFAISTHIAKDSVLEIIFTLAGTTPILGDVTVEFDYLEG